MLHPAMPPPTMTTRACSFILALLVERRPEAAENQSDDRGIDYVLEDHQGRAVPAVGPSIDRLAQGEPETKPSSEAVRHRDPYRRRHAWVRRSSQRARSRWSMRAPTLV